MILLIFTAIIFGFLLIGASVFVISVLMPFSREHALSAALWCAAWGPCIVALLMLAGLGLLGDVLAQEHSRFEQLQRLLSLLAPAYAVIGVTGTAAVASVAAWLHQGLIHRFTFALFRLYACLVCAGIGSVFGWSIGFWFSASSHGNLPLWLSSMLLLCLSFGYGGFHYAHHLRGGPPKNLTWITPAEFEGKS